MSSQALIRHKTNHMVRVKDEAVPMPGGLLLPAPEDIPRHLQETANMGASPAVQLGVLKVRLESILEQVNPDNIVGQVLIIKELKSLIIEAARLMAQQADMMQRREIGEISPELKAMIDRVNE